MRALAFIGIIAALLAGDASPAFAAREFTIDDEIGLAELGDNSYQGKVEAITWSPNREFIAVHAGRGLLSENRIESEVRIYRVSDVSRYVTSKIGTRAPIPVWTIKLSTYKEAPIVQSLRWDAASKGFAFLARTEAGRLRLYYANIASHTLAPISREDQDVSAFDLLNSRDYVYTVRDTPSRNPNTISRMPMASLTGMALYDLLFPADSANRTDRAQLWSARDGSPIPLINPDTGLPIILFTEGQNTLSLSPDGNILLTATPVPEVPIEWQQEFRPERPSDPNYIAPGRQNFDGPSGRHLTSQYTLIDLKTGRERFPLNAPTGRAASWSTYAKPAWAPDDTKVVLPNAFVSSAEHASIAPCAAVFDLATNEAQCLESLKIPATAIGKPQTGAARMKEIIFHSSAKGSISISFSTDGQNTTYYSRYEKQSTGGWRGSPVTFASNRLPRIEVNQDFEHPPMLVARKRMTTPPRIVWDPNPQLKDLELGDVKVMKWKDESGRDWLGGLYLPPNYKTGQRYPLVIQTHNFAESVFRPSGLYPTGYAARALAAKGIVVLQTRCAERAVTPTEGPCQVLGYDSAVEILSEQGLIDRDRVGIIGFSRTGYYVLQALTKSRVHFKAALFTDSINNGYWQNLATVDYGNEAFAREDFVMNGGHPYGEGLKNWQMSAPTFNMDKVKTPLQIVGEGMLTVMGMWEPYALLRYQNKPVDLVMLNTEEHVLTNPIIRKASQSNTVDWMQFWLQGYEDPDPAKVERYRRWRELRRLQDAQAGTAAR